MRLSIPFVLFSSLIVPAAALATSDRPKADKAARYPFDPACPWGRLSNGKGMIHRCITESEARSLAIESPKPNKDPAPRPDAKPEKNESDDPKERPLPRSFDLTVGPISAEQGEITVGRLDVPMDLYRACVDENGGLKSDSAKVIVKFLVRAERVRAEGASVESFEHVSTKAAECIAAVVDRRQVGTPSVPMTGASLTFSFRKK